MQADRDMRTWLRAWARGVNLSQPSTNLVAEHATRPSMLESTCAEAARIMPREFLAQIASAKLASIPAMLLRVVLAAPGENLRHAGALAGGEGRLRGGRF